MELEITWERATKVWWSYIWRYLIAIVVAALLSVTAGFILGYFMAALGVSIQTIRIVVAPIGVIIGLLGAIVPMKMILGKDFGEFRLVLVKKEADNE